MTPSDYARMGYKIFPRKPPGTDGKAGFYADLSWKDLRDQSPEDCLAITADYQTNSYSLITGNEANLAVIDIDIDKRDRNRHGWQTLEEWGITRDDFEDAPCQRSKSGGYHYFFKMPDPSTLPDILEMEDGLTSSQRIELVDIRAKDSNITVAPTPGYIWKRPLREAELLPEFPGAVVDYLAHLVQERLQAYQEEYASQPGFDPGAPIRDARKYWENFRDGRVADLRNMADGTGRNAALFGAARDFASFIGSGLVTQCEVQSILMDVAMHHPDGPISTPKETIRSGLRRPNRKLSERLREGARTASEKYLTTKPSGKRQAPKACLEGNKKPPITQQEKPKPSEWTGGLRPSTDPTQSIHSLRSAVQKRIYGQMASIPSSEDYPDLITSDEYAKLAVLVKTRQADPDRMARVLLGIKEEEAVENEVSWRPLSKRFVEAVPDPDLLAKVERWLSVPKLTVGAGNLTEFLEQAHQIMALQEDVFYRAADNRLVRISGAQIQELGSECTTASYLDARCRIEKRTRKGGFEPTVLSRDYERHIEKSSDRYGLRPLEGVRRLPYFVGERLVTQPGWDESGIYLDPIVDVEEIPTEPSDEEVARAAKIYRDHLNYYQFADESSFANAVGAHLIALGRGAWLGPTLGILIQANRSGSGKSELAKSIGRIANGTPPAAGTQSADVEFRKLLGATVRRNPTGLIWIDNVRRAMRSPILESLITSETIGSRLLGQSVLDEIRNQLLVVITANCPELTEDLARRCVPINLIRNADIDPSEPLGVRAERRLPQLVWAGLTLLRAQTVRCRDVWVDVAGFGECARFIAGALEIGGIYGFMKDARAQLAESSHVELPDELECALEDLEREGEAVVRVSDILRHAEELYREEGKRFDHNTWRRPIQEHLFSRPGWDLPDSKRTWRAIPPGKRSRLGYWYTYKAESYQ